MDQPVVLFLFKFLGDSQRAERCIINGGLDAKHESSIYSKGSSHFFFFFKSKNE